jgi:hypothetical protein
VTRSVILAEASVTCDIDQISSLAGTCVMCDCQIDRNATVSGRCLKFLKIHLGLVLPRRFWPQDFCGRYIWFYHIDYVKILLDMQWKAPCWCCELQKEGV